MTIASEPVHGTLVSEPVGGDRASSLALRYALRNSVLGLLILLDCLGLGGERLLRLVSMVRRVPCHSHPYQR